MITTNLFPILHHFGDTAFQILKIAIFGYPSCVYTPRRRGSPGTISVKFSVDVNRWPRYENFTNVTDDGQTYRQTDRQTTDGTAISYSEREREFVFAKNGSRDVTTPISGTVS